MNISRNKTTRKKRTTIQKQTKIKPKLSKIIDSR